MPIVPGASPTPEDRLPLLDERLRRLTVVAGHATTSVVPGLQVERVFEAAALGRVEVALHVAERDPRPAGKPAGQRERLFLEPRVGHDAVHDPELARLRGVYDVRRVVE